MKTPFRRLMISEPARAIEFGAAIIERFQADGKEVFVCVDDNALESLVSRDERWTLFVGARPPMPWLKNAEHGSLAVRHEEYYVNAELGCQASCAYCFLRGMDVGLRPLRLYVDFENLAATIEMLLDQEGPDVLFAPGELSDSLGNTDLYPLGPELVRLFQRLGRGSLELRTKSDCVQALPVIEGESRTVAAFSISPQTFIDKNEPGTASLEQRLFAARICQEKGYPVAFKVEPIVINDDTLPSYRALINEMSRCVDMARIHHVTLGCLRWSDSLAENPTFQKHYGKDISNATWLSYREGKKNGTYSDDLRQSVYHDIARWFIEAGTPNSFHLSLETEGIVEAFRVGLQTSMARS